MTYDCPNDGIVKPERRKHPRPAEHDTEVESIFNGFANMIENERDAYTRGYITAMRNSFAELVRARGHR